MKKTEEFEILERPDLPSNCPEYLKVWYLSYMEPTIQRSLNRVECYENYCYLNNIPMEMSWKVNLRKQITYNNKLYK